MKKNIHPQYNSKAIVTCACGAKFYVCSTVDKMEIEICSKCHPFYTGQEKLVDTTGRVQKFKKRLEKTKDIKSKKHVLSPSAVSSGSKGKVEGPVLSKVEGIEKKAEKKTKKQIKKE